MTSRALSFEELGITPADIYEQMGYGTSLPDEATEAETLAMLDRIARITKPRFCFFFAEGKLDTENSTLEVMGKQLAIGKIIMRQLRGSQLYAFFVATAGEEFEQLQHELKSEGDMVKIFIADAIGSVVAEKTADRMEVAIEELIEPLGMHHTNRFSPGYCGWHVSEQQLLFPMFGEEKPCGVSLTQSSLMTPIKSVSGVIGLGENVRKLEYSCGLCDFKHCYKRKTPPKRP